MLLSNCGEKNSVTTGTLKAVMNFVNKLHILVGFTLCNINTKLHYMLRWSGVHFIFRCFSFPFSAADCL